jgi:exodeoxyribonuclease VII large subunit
MRERIGALRRHLSALTERPVLVRPDAALREPTMRLSLLSERMDGAVSAQLRDLASSLSSRAAKLEALSPLSTLARGYAAAERGDGKPLRSVREIAEGELLRLRLSDGSVAARVETLLPNECE